MKQKGIWLRNGWRLHHLNAAELALALLVREKPLTVLLSSVTCIMYGQC